MRTLFLLRGLPGAGKSIWIKENHLEPYTLSPDQIRTEFQSPVFDEQGNPSISQSNDGEVWDVLMKRLKVRMRRGDFTVIDATHYIHRMLTHYNQLIHEYRYKKRFVRKSCDYVLPKCAVRKERIDYACHVRYYCRLFPPHSLHVLFVA